MIRVIVFILVFVFFLAFIVLNLENKCDVSFGFTTIKDFPIFLSVLFSFVLGMFITVPMMLFRKKKPKPSIEESFKPVPSKKAELKSLPDDIKKEDSPYGID
jgi:uncharacterized integral membrane protein